jgi:hypothetical protein
MHTSSPRQLAVLIAAALLAACGESPPPAAGRQPPPQIKVEEPAVQPAAVEAAGDHELVWLPDGSQLMVDGYWVFDPERGAFASLQCTTASGAPCNLSQSSFVRDGREYVVVDGDNIAVGMPVGGLGPWEQIPRWLPQEQEPAEIVNTAFWVAPGRVLVRQFFKDGHGEAQCRVRYTANRVYGDWRRPDGGCLGGELGNLAQVDPGPNGLFALHSSAQGQFSLSIVRYSLDTGVSEVRTALAAIGGVSRVQVQFAPDGSRAELTSPCQLTVGNREMCQDPFKQPRWNLYSLPIPGETIELLRADLPPGTAVDPVRNRFAWVKEGAVCVGEPRDPEARCEPLPVR